MSHVARAPENVAYLTLFFATDLIAHIHVNWLAPVKVRRTLIGGSKKMIVYDDLEPSEKVKVYDRGVTVADDTENLYRVRIGYRTGDMWAPRLDGKEALRAEAEHFIRCIETGERPLTDARCRPAHRPHPRGRHRVHQGPRPARRKSRRRSDA